MLLGLGVAFFCVFLSFFAFYGTSFDEGLPFQSKLSIATTLLFAPAAMFLIGMAIHNPLALRMDKDGISGFYTSPAKWSEIESIKLINGTRNTKSLGFALEDPIGFRDRQTPFQRFTSWMNGRSTGYHISIPETVLKNTNVAELLDQAKRFHAAQTHTRM